MKTKIFSLNNSKLLINNSSLITAENSSFQSKFNNRKNRLKSKEENKYSNTAIFEIPRRGQSNDLLNNKKNYKKSLYLTDILDTTPKNELKNKSTFELTKIDYKVKKRELSNELLPKIIAYKKYIRNPECFTCCNKKIEPKYLTRLYNEQHMKNNIEDLILNKKANIISPREDKNIYIKKTNDIKKIKYEINLKKEAMIEYRDNLKNHLNSINYTIKTIKEYKNNLDNTFLNKYNEDLRLLNSKLREEKNKSNIQNKELLDLKKDVSSLQLLIRKKEETLKKIKKWLILQIHLKEGVKPKDLNEALEKRYKNKLIFETPEELYITFKHKEDKNVRLLNEYNKSDEEKKIYINELLELERHFDSMTIDTENSITEKENILLNLKKKKVELDISLNELNSLKIKYLQIKNNNNHNQTKRSKSVNNNVIISNNENDIKKNSLGIYYKPIKNHNDMFTLIDCIYMAFIKNDIAGLTLESNFINEINNINTSKSKKANIKMKIIEIGLNYLYSSIYERINTNKNNLKIMEDTYHLIDLYHKKVNGKKNRLELDNKRSALMKKIEDKNKRVYFLPKGKIEKFNIVAIKKKLEKDKLKNKKVIKKIDIWDFLHDRVNEDNYLDEKKRTEA